MFRTKYLRVSVQIQDNHVTHVDIPAWELEVLRLVHTRGEGSVDPVTVIEEKWRDKVPPEANDEWQRLSNRYRRSQNEDGSQGPPYVAVVYGAYGVGQHKLGAAIKAATDEVADAPAVDPLLGEQNSSVGG
jgi:hypothetical protein